MIRAPLGNSSYWDEWVKYAENRFKEIDSIRNQPAGDPSYEPQYVFQLTQKQWHQILRRYSRGDAIGELAEYFPPLLDAWEESERLGKGIWTEQQQYTRHAWVVNFDHYIICFWLVGLALALNIPEDQWCRLVALIGNEGEDILLDRIIATRSTGRKVGTQLCFKKPYGRLLEAIDSPKAEQAQKLKEFVGHWYADLATTAKSGRAKQAVPYLYPYWYKYGDENFEGGAYFGRWCVEAVAAVKALELDDSLCLGHEHYPGDLLRPHDPTTHPVRETESPEQGPQTIDLTSKQGLFAKWLGKK